MSERHVNGTRPNVGREEPLHQYRSGAIKIGKIENPSSPLVRKKPLKGTDGCSMPNTFIGAVYNTELAGTPPGSIYSQFNKSPYEQHPDIINTGKDDLITQRNSEIVPKSQEVSEKERDLSLPDYFSPEKSGFIAPESVGDQGPWRMIRKATFPTIKGEGDAGGFVEITKIPEGYEPNLGGKRYTLLAKRLPWAGKFRYEIKLQTEDIVDDLESERSSNSTVEVRAREIWAKHPSAALIKGLYLENNRSKVDPDAGVYSTSVDTERWVLTRLPQYEGKARAITTEENGEIVSITGYGNNLRPKKIEKFPKSEAESKNPNGDTAFTNVGRLEFATDFDENGNPIGARQVGIPTGTEQSVEGLKALLGGPLVSELEALFNASSDPKGIEGALTEINELNAMFEKDDGSNGEKVEIPDVEELEEWFNQKTSGQTAETNPSIEQTNQVITKAEVAVPAFDKNSDDSTPAIPTIAPFLELIGNIFSRPTKTPQPKEDPTYFRVVDGKVIKSGEEKKPIEKKGSPIYFSVQPDGKVTQVINSENVS